MTLVNTDYSIAPLWCSRIISDPPIIPLGFDSSPGHKTYNCGSPLMRSMYIYICVYIYIYASDSSSIYSVLATDDG